MPFVLVYGLLHFFTFRAVVGISFRVLIDGIFDFVDFFKVVFLSASLMAIVSAAPY